MAAIDIHDRISFITFSSSNQQCYVYVIFISILFKVKRMQLFGCIVYTCRYHHSMYLNIDINIITIRHQECLHHQCVLYLMLEKHILITIGLQYKSILFLIDSVQFSLILSITIINYYCWMMKKDKNIFISLHNQVIDRHDIKSCKITIV